MAWTDKMVEELKSLWQTGLTTSEIAKKLGVSKNSIVGKVHRLSLSGRPSPIKKKDEEETVVSVKEEISIVEEVVEIEESSSCDEYSEIPEQPDGLVRLTDLDNHTCRWPIGDPKDENFHFCGKNVRSGQTYCDEHSAIAYVKAIKK